MTSDTEKKLLAEFVYCVSQCCDSNKNWTQEDWDDLFTGLQESLKGGPNEERKGPDV